MDDVVLFGDSITAGWNQDEGITDALTKRVTAKIPFTVRNAGIPGDTTIEALKRLSAHVLKYHPKMVVVFFGANDCAIYRNITCEEYLTNIEEIVQTIGPEKVVLVGPPYVNQKVQQRERPLAVIETFSDALADWAKKHSVTFLPLLERMQCHQPESWLQSDGLHFSEIGYDYLAALYSQEIMQKMRELK